MPARVTLQVRKGNLAGQEFVFDERTTCIIGRSLDCTLVIPTDEDHRTISRHHCLLDINPPDVRVRDFGSLNGTYVNGHKIGQRAKHQGPEEAAAIPFPEHDLKNGDNIRLGTTSIRVGVQVPATCAECGAEIPEDHKSAAANRPCDIQCDDCRDKARQLATAQKAKLATPRAQPVRKTLAEEPRLCVECGRDVSAEAPHNRTGNYVCVSCRANPTELIGRLLHQANQNDKNLAVIEGYEIVRELGQGGMGAVYLARSPRLRQEVALKVMLPQVAANVSATEKFLREIDNTKVLQHPHVVRLYDSGCSHGTFFFTLEYCTKGSVDKLMQDRGGTLPVEEAVTIMCQVLEGLEYAHKVTVPRVQLENGKVGTGHGLVHRDLKPQNIFLTASGSATVAKVGDYGLAKAFDLAGLSGHTCTGTAAGTPYFMPRQQVLQFRFAEPEVDVWAAAASLYCMLTGCVPREFVQGRDVWQTVLQSKPVPIRRRTSAVPARLAAVIDEALIDNPDIRIKSAGQLKGMLKGAL